MAAMRARARAATFTIAVAAAASAAASSPAAPAASTTATCPDGVDRLAAWQARWDKRRTNFHLASVNHALLKHEGELCADDQRCRILFPLVSGPLPSLTANANATTTASIVSSSSSSSPSAVGQRQHHWPLCLSSEP